jgi:acyl-homoserine lactone acylase PvdQ
LSTGQSGNIISPHYKDMSEHWRKGEYAVIRTDEESIKLNKQRLTFYRE